MPPKKRTSQSKNTPSPTASTNYASADHHHHLRHTGPSLSARAAAGAIPSKPPPAQPEPKYESPPTPKVHDEKPLAKVSPPGARTPFFKFIYGLLFIALLFSAWYVYGMVALLERLKEEAGWWGLITGDAGGMVRWDTWRTQGGPDYHKGGEGKMAIGRDVEVSLNALAGVLGISPVELASAIKPVVPEASLMRVAANTEEMHRSEAVRVLLEDTTQNSED